MATLLPQSEPVYLDADRAVSQIGDLQAMQHMLTLLQESLARDIPKIARLIDAHDLAGANLLLHSIKGFIPIFCGPALSERVSQIELLSKDSDSTTISAAYAGLQPELQRLLAEVSAYLKDHGASH